MSFGIIPEGFRLKRLENIMSDLERNLRARWPEIDLSPASVFGQLIGVFSYSYTEMWEQLQKVYDCKRPSSAEGIQLDDILALNGLTRLEPKPTIVEVSLNGTKNTIVPNGTIVRNRLTNDLYSLQFDTKITNDDVSRIFVRIVNYVESTDYTITIQGRTYTVNSGISGTKLDICQLFETAISSDSLCVADVMIVGDDTLELTQKNTVFNVEVGNEIEYLTPANFECTENGLKLSIYGSVTIIETPWSGLDKVFNFIDGIPGRDFENDAEARIRRSQSLQQLGAGTLPSIVSRVGNDIDGVSHVKGFENREDIVVSGRPPHSFEIVVVGGDNQEIANLLWAIKPAGIQTFGNAPNNTGVGFNVIDANGDTQVIHFSRPVNKFAFINVILSLYSEEIFPTDGINTVKNNILNYGETFTIGMDIIPERFFGFIYSVPGILKPIVTIAVTDNEGDTPSYQSTPISINPSWIAQFSLSRIFVTVV